MAPLPGPQTHRAAFLSPLHLGIMENQDQATNTTPVEEDTVQATNMAQLTFAIGSWFNDTHAAARQFLEVPDGMEIEVQTTAGGPIEAITLTGDAHKAFTAGVIAVINLFSELPFRVDSGTEVASQEELDEALAAKAANDATPSQQ